MQQLSLNALYRPYVRKINAAKLIIELTYYYLILVQMNALCLREGKLDCLKDNLVDKVTQKNYFYTVVNVL